jgi:hypothetical protein
VKNIPTIGNTHKIAPPLTGCMDRSLALSGRSLEIFHIVLSLSNKGIKTCESGENTNSHRLINEQTKLVDPHNGHYLAFTKSKAPMPATTQGSLETLY